MNSLRAKFTRVALLAAVACSAVATGGCDHLRQDMGTQPKYLPLEPSDFFQDGRSERPLLENTVARGSVANDELMLPKDSNSFPASVPVTQELLERGKERYGAYCTPCHGLQGDGNGMVVMRGMKRPPSYHSERLRESPNGYFYDVITNGFGQMYGYASQIPQRDRWAIVAYVRALQLSRNAHAAELPTELRQKLSSGEGAK
jgi:mono/diheme cytochrome c family protein